MVHEYILGLVLGAFLREPLKWVLRRSYVGAGRLCTSVTSRFNKNQKHLEAFNKRLLQLEDSSRDLRNFVTSQESYLTRLLMIERALGWRDSEGNLTKEYEYAKERWR